jgi:nucleotide-binding universal stress UspA family protein
MPETILCAADDSEAAEVVLDTARGLAGALGADLVVVHVDDGDADAVRARLGAAGAVPELRLLDGSPADAIIETADR